MKVALNGARHWSSQIPRIEDGFRALGHEITPHWHEADLVYSNDSHAQVVRDKQEGKLKPGAKVILTCLDVPEHLFGQGYDVAPLKAQLQVADAVCTISQFGRWQVRHYCGLDSHVIYQPIIPVARQRGPGEPAEWRFLHCGRRGDPNKRFALGVQAIQLLGFTARDLMLVGNEPGWGDYYGVLDPRGVEIAYNSADFVLCTSRLEGLLLPCLEAMAAGAVPVVCNDLTTLDELLPPDLFPEYREVEPTPISIARFIGSFLTEGGKQRLADLKDALHTHYLVNWRDRTSPKGVARAILRAYDRSLAEQGTVHV